MNYLIDGHNLISKIPGLDLRMPDDEQQLIELLSRFAMSGKKHIEVYFDRAAVGEAGERNFGRVRAHFVQQNLTADQAIVNRLRSLKKSGRNWVVVTSDRSVQAAAREAHARVISSEELADQIQNNLPAAEDSQDPAEKTLSEAELRQWLDLFKGRHHP